MIPSMTNGHTTHTPEHPEERRTPTTTIAVLLASLISGTGGSMITYGVSHRPRPPCAATAKECTCPSCPAGQACYRATCTCVSVAAEAALRDADRERRLRVLEQRLAGECGGNITEAELR